MGIYYCHGCQAMKDDDHSPMGDNDCCDECNAVLEGWSITHNPKPIPDFSHDWDFVHEDYDGENGLCGTAAGYHNAVHAIIELEKEREYETPV